MADLKKLEEVEARIDANAGRIVADASRQLAEETKSILDDFAQGLRAAEGLRGKAASDLLLTAEVVIAKDIEISQTYNDEPTPVSAHLRVNNQQTFDLNDARSAYEREHAPRVRRGKYRALFFLMKLPE